MNVQYVKPFGDDPLTVDGCQVTLKADDTTSLPTAYVANLNISLNTTIRLAIPGGVSGDLQAYIAFRDVNGVKDTALVQSTHYDPQSGADWNFDTRSLKDKYEAGDQVYLTALFVDLLSENYIFGPNSLPLSFVD